jgi:hypothetical protein
MVGGHQVIMWDGGVVEGWEAQALLSFRLRKGKL